MKVPILPGAWSASVGILSSTTLLKYSDSNQAFGYPISSDYISC
jgi:hypothetical protein